MRFVLTALLVYFASPALACHGPMMESQTYLAALPDEADQREVIARVRILSTQIITEGKRMHNRLSKAEVIEPVKGVSLGDTLTVYSERHSCARDAEVKKSEEYFIAGSVDKSGIFTGSWKGLWYDPFWPIE